MSFLQREPISVNAAVGCTPANELIEATAFELLSRSQSLRPHAGAVIRLAVQEGERQRLLALDKEGQENALAEASFLPPINRALSNWWYGNPPADYTKPTQMNFYRLIDSPKITTVHMDQGVLEQHHTNPIPEGGPLTALLTLRGSVRYLLNVTRKDPFNSRNLKFFTGDNPPDGFVISGGHEVTTNPGDLLMFVNTPPTFHSATPLEDRLTAHFGTYFVPT